MVSDIHVCTFKEYIRLDLILCIYSSTVLGYCCQLAYGQVIEWDGKRVLSIFHIKLIESDTRASLYCIDKI